MFVCKFCGEEYEELVDHSEKGFWCEMCDGFTYFDKEEHKFLLILENGEKESVKALKTSLKKQVSPLRYPGGKSKLIDYLSTKFSARKIKTFIEPFAGSASVGLSLLTSGLVDKLVLNDLDKGIYGLYKTILENPDFLIDRINNVTPDHDLYFNFRNDIKTGYIGLNENESGWRFLVVNRLAYSGIVKANPLGGKNGELKKLLSRWSKDELIKKIKLIHAHANKIEILNMDALEVIEDFYWNDKTTIFVDPPYFLKGEALYNHAYINKDHIELQNLLDSLYMGCPGADIVLTYDDHEYIKTMYQYPEQIIIGRKFSA